MSFRESIIIPLEVFEKCQFDNEQDILLDPSIPVDKRMKLYHQKKALEKKKPPEEKEEEAEEVGERNFQYIVDAIQMSYRPFAHSILDYLKNYQDQITWNDNMEVIIDGRLYPDSNILDLFHFLMKNKVITSPADIPIAGMEFYDKLLEIGIPKEWMKIRFPSKSSSRHKKKRARLPDYQVGRGRTWISL